MNVILSSNPCPTCIEARGKVMTITAWRRSKFGLPGSNKRYCKANCHCILVPVDLIDQLPAIGKKAKLRGDDLTDIKKTVDIHPNEERLKELMDEYNMRIGKLPEEIYEMPLDDVIPYLENLLRPGGAGGIPSGLPMSVEQAEKSIMKQFKLDGNEHSIALDDAGNTLLMKGGRRSAVDYTADDILRMNHAAVHIHNHPSGCSFSAGDLDFYSYINVRKAIVETPKYTYELSPTTATWPGGSALKAGWNSEKLATADRFQVKYHARVEGGMAREEAGLITWIEQCDAIMRNLAERYNLTYTRIKKGK